MKKRVTNTISYLSAVNICGYFVRIGKIIATRNNNNDGNNNNNDNNIEYNRGELRATMDKKCDLVGSGSTDVFIISLEQSKRLRNN